MNNYDTEQHFFEYHKQRAMKPTALVNTLAEMGGQPGQLEAEGKALADVGNAFAKGVVSAGIGTLPDLVGIATGLLNMLSVDPEEKGNYQQFAEGFDTVPFTTEKINNWLTGLGWQPIKDDLTQASQLIGELVAPTKIAETLIKKGVQMYNKSKGFEAQVKEAGLPSTQEVLETYAGGGVIKNIGKAGIGKAKSVVNKLKKGQPIKDHQFRKEIEKNTQNAWSDLRTDKQFMKQYRIINNNKTLSREDKIEKLTQWVNKHINEYPE